MKKILAIAVIAAMCFTMFAACADNTEKVGLKIYDGQTEVTKIETGLGAGESVILKAKNLDGTEVEEDIVWTSSNTAVATVSSYGTVTGVKFGEVTIKAKAGNNYATCTVKIIPLLALDKTEMSLLPAGEGIPVSVSSGAITATANPADAQISWATENSAIATVEAGTVTAVAVGTTKVTATFTKDGATATATCNVSVVAAESTAKVTFNVDITEGLKSVNLAKMEDWMGIYLVGDAFSWAGPNAVVGGFGEDNKLTHVEGNKYTITKELDLTETVEGTDGELVPKYARNTTYKYVLAGYRADENPQYSYVYEAYNGSNVENRPLFLNGEATQNDQVTVFQGVPTDPQKPATIYTVTFNIKFETSIGESKVALVGDFGGDYGWKPNGGDDGKYVLTKGTDDVYTLTVEMSSKNEKTPQFKLVLDANWDTSFGGGSVYIGTDATGTLVGGDNMEIEIKGAVVDGKVPVTLNLFVKNALAA